MNAHRTRTHLPSIILALAILLATGAPGPATAVEPGFIGSLAPGDVLFWEGPYLDSVGTGTRVSDGASCEGPAATTRGCEHATMFLQPTAVVADFSTIVLQRENSLCGTEHVCLEYSFDVVGGGNVLRVALDQGSLRDFIFVYLYDPNGRRVTKLHRTFAESWITDPAAGRWTVRVEVFDARNSSFRMRAALDPGGAAPESGVLLPNLQVFPRTSWDSARARRPRWPAMEPDGACASPRDRPMSGMGPWTC